MASSWFKLYSSVLCSSMWKAIFERTKVFKFCWVIYTKVFSRISLNFLPKVFFFDSKTSFLIVNAFQYLQSSFIVKVRIFLNKYDNMLKSNQSPKLLILLLLCQPCRYEYYSIFDYHHFAIFCFLDKNFYYGDLCIFANYIFSYY